MIDSWAFWVPQESFDCSQPLRELVERLQRFGGWTVRWREFHIHITVSSIEFVSLIGSPKNQAPTSALLFQWRVESRCLANSPVFDEN